MKLARLALLSVLSLAACYDDDSDGYYWWDETDDVWCFTYDNGETVCDDPQTPTRSMCTDRDDGSRHCEVLDGGYLCVFDYAADGTITPGACVLVSDEESPVRRDCEPAADGSLICQFQNSEGTECVVIFASDGSVAYDSCGYFAPVTP